MTPSRINQLTLYWLHLQYCSITQTVFDLFNMAFNDLSQDSSIFQDRKSFKAADYLCITHYAYQFSSINCFYRNLLLFSTHFKQNYVSARIFSIFQELISYGLTSFVYFLSIKVLKIFWSSPFFKTPRLVAVIAQNRVQLPKKFIRVNLKQGNQTSP